MNGKKTAETVFGHLKIKKNEIETAYSNINRDKVQKTKIYYGNYNNTKVLGWNLTLEPSVPEEKNIQAFCDLIKNNIKEVF